jgi:hypothetical protein
MSNDFYLASKDLIIDVIQEDVVRVSAGHKTFDLKGNQIKQLFISIIPKLNGSQKLEEILTAEELQLIEPALDQLVQMGVIFKVSREQSLHLKGDREKFRYTYLARRTFRPEDVFKQGSRKIFFFTNLTPLKELLSIRLDDFSSIPYEIVTEFTSIDLIREALFVPILCESDEHLLNNIQSFCFERNIRFCPVIIKSSAVEQVEIGPWVYPGESSCTSCFASGSQKTANRSDISLMLNPVYLDLLLTTLFHSYYQTFTGHGEHTPWGKKTTLRLESGEHRNFRIPKDPFCDKCKNTLSRTEPWEVV